ncbi:MAG TPA: hypothetical protein VF646_18385, partial [Cytophagales bacterium]
LGFTLPGTGPVSGGSGPRGPIFLILSGEQQAHTGLAYHSGVLWGKIPFDVPYVGERTKYSVFILDMVVKNRHIALFPHVPEQLPK